MFLAAKTFSVHRRVRNHYSKRILNLILNRKKFLQRGNGALGKQKPRQNPLPRQIQRATPSPQISSTLRGGSSPPFLQYVIPAMYLPLSVKVANIKSITRLDHISLAQFMHLDFYHHVAWRKILFQDLHIDAFLEIRHEILRLGNLCRRNLRDICYSKIPEIVFSGTAIKEICAIARTHRTFKA